MAELTVPGEELEQGVARFVALVAAGRGRPRQVALPPASRHWAQADPAAFPWVPELQRLLRQHWGHDDLRGLQLPVINALLSGKDVFTVMPTGAGKSLCYQLPILLQTGVAVVVSPLLSLMQDQVQALQTRAVKAARLGSDTSKAEEAQVLADLEAGNLSLLYVSPERMVYSSENCHRLTRALRQKHGERCLRYFVLDEAHCISQWGLDFRKQYRQLSCLRRDYPGVPILAATASATERVKKDVIRSLDMQQAVQFQDTFDRPNLFLEVRQKASDAKVVEEIAALARQPLSSGSRACGIVYTLSRKETESVARSLTQAGVASRAYHAGLPPHTRRATFEAWMRGECQVVVATVAFGMGIDKRDVRLVCHTCVPSSMERYHQEIGRAGRDGSPCRCVLWYSPADVQRLRKMASKKHEQEQIDLASRFCGDGSVCRRAALLAYFGEQHQAQRCDACDVCSRRQSGGSGSQPQQRQQDLTVEAQQLLALAAALQEHGLTAAKLRDAAKGKRLPEATGRAKNLSAAAAAHGAFGALRAHSPDFIERLIDKLKQLGVFVERKERAKGFGKGKRFANLYLALGKEADRLRAGATRVALPAEAGAVGSAAPEDARAPPAPAPWAPEAGAAARAPEATAAGTATRPAAQAAAPAAAPAVSAACGSAEPPAKRRRASAAVQLGPAASWPLPGAAAAGDATAAAGAAGPAAAGAEDPASSADELVTIPGSDPEDELPLRGGAAPRGAAEVRSLGQVRSPGLPREPAPPAAGAAPEGQAPAGHPHLAQTEAAQAPAGLPHLAQAAAAQAPAGHPHLAQAAAAQAPAGHPHLAQAAAAQALALSPAGPPLLAEPPLPPALSPAANAGWIPKMSRAAQRNQLRWHGAPGQGAQG